MGGTELGGKLEPLYPSAGPLIHPRTLSANGTLAPRSNRGKTSVSAVRQACVVYLSDDVFGYSLMDINSSKKRKRDATDVDELTRGPYTEGVPAVAPAQRAGIAPKDGALQPMNTLLREMHLSARFRKHQISSPAAPSGPVEINAAGDIVQKKVLQKRGNSGL